jgi:WD40 repeat protein
VALSEDGKYLAANSGGTFTLVWDLPKAKKKHTFKRVDEVEGDSIAISPDNKTLAVSGWSHAATLFDLTTGKELAKLKDQEKILALAFDKTGETLAIASEDGSTVIWDVKKREKKKTLKGGHEGKIYTMVYSQDGRTVVTSGWDEKIVVWDVEKGKPRLTHVTRKDAPHTLAMVNHLALTPDGERLAFASGPEVYLFDDINAENEPFYPIEDLSLLRKSNVHTLAFSPDGNWFAAGGSKIVRIAKVPEKRK